MAEEDKEIIKRPEDNLTKIEQEELTKYRRSDGYAPLAASTAVRLYQLFLLGHSCEEIVRTNDNRFPLGMVVDARIRHDWDRRRTEYIDRLYEEAGSMVRQRQVESAMFLGDMLAAAHAEYGPKFQKFIQSRDPKDLPPEFKIDTPTKYKMVIDGLMKITGQDKKDAAGAAVQVIGNNVMLQESGSKTVTSQEGFDILKQLERLDSEKVK